MKESKLDLGPCSIDVITRIKSVWEKCDKETQKLIDDLFGYWQTSAMDLDVFNLRLQKQWTKNSELYTKEELNKETTEAYNVGYKDGENNYYGDIRGYDESY